MELPAGKLNVSNAFQADAEQKKLVSSMFFFQLIYQNVITREVN